ncbi:MAG: hypothetical protein ACNI27_05025 [Desulfovibrio sp.]
MRLLADIQSEKEAGEVLHLQVKSLYPNIQLKELRDEHKAMSQTPAPRLIQLFYETRQQFEHKATFLPKLLLVSPPVRHKGFLKALATDAEAETLYAQLKLICALLSDSFSNAETRITVDYSPWLVPEGLEHEGIIKSPTNSALKELLFGCKMPPHGIVQTHTLYKKDRVVTKLFTEKTLSEAQNTRIAESIIQLQKDCDFDLMGKGGLDPTTFGGLLPLLLTGQNIALHGIS